MTIGELITYLKKVEAEEGNLPVGVLDKQLDWYGPIEQCEAINARCGTDASALGGRFLAISY